MVLKSFFKQLHTSWYCHESLSKCLLWITSLGILIISYFIDSKVMSKFNEYWSIYRTSCDQIAMGRREENGLPMVAWDNVNWYYRFTNSLFSWSPCGLLTEACTSGSPIILKKPQILYIDSYSMHVLLASSDFVC